MPLPGLLLPVEQDALLSELIWLQADVVRDDYRLSESGTLETWDGMAFKVRGADVEGCRAERAEVFRIV